MSTHLIELNIQRFPFSRWFVLQEKEGKGVLGAIEGTPEGYYVYPDVFKTKKTQHTT